jgi:hypothetical protein
MCITTFGTDYRSTDFQDPHQQLKESIGPYDILCGRHKAAFNNIGNRRFRITVKLQLDRYLRAPTRLDKSLVIQWIVLLVKNNNGGRFLKWDKRSKGWIELDDKEARAKVGHAIRDMITASGQSEVSFDGGHQRHDASEHSADEVPASILSSLSITEVTLASGTDLNYGYQLLERRQAENCAVLSEYNGVTNALTVRVADDFDEALFDELDDLTTEEQVMIVNIFKSDDTDISDATCTSLEAM